MEEKGEKSGGLSKLTREQLLEYIKKQNAKVKKLQHEKETLHNEVSMLQKKIVEDSAAHDEDKYVMQPSPNDISPSMLGKVSFQQKTAAFALAHLFAPPASVSTTRVLFVRAFYMWKSVSDLSRKKAKDVELEELRKANIALEQKYRILFFTIPNTHRTSKLKSLLARLQQSNQRSSEDTESLKRIQQEVAAQYEQYKIKEQSEKETLQDTIRYLSLQSALQSDVDTVIEQALQRLQATSASSGPPSNPTVVTPPIERDTEEQLARCEEELRVMRDKIMQADALCASLHQDKQHLQQQCGIRDKQLEQLQHQLKEEVLLKNDIEVELSLLLKHQQERKDEQLATLTSVKQEYETQLAALAAEHNAAQQSINKLTEQNNFLQRKVNESMSLVQDNTHLKRVILDLKSGLSMRRMNSNSELNSDDKVNLTQQLEDMGFVVLKRSYFGKNSSTLSLC